MLEGFFDRRIPRTLLALFDQGTASLGNFAVGIVLARNLSQTEFGTYALVFTGLLVLQLINGSLVFHPLLMQIGADPTRKPQLAKAGVLAIGMLLVPQCLLIAVGLTWLGRLDLLAPSVAWFSAWQMHEALRRCLLAEFRHGTALIGDCVAYLGQVAIVLSVLASGSSSVLALVFLGLSTSFACGLLLHALTLPFSAGSRLNFRLVFAEMTEIGRWLLADNAINAIRLWSLPWALAATTGVAVAAQYQAAANILTVLSPFFAGMMSVLTQLAARCGADQNKAWTESRLLMLAGSPIVFGYCAIAMLFPEAMLGLLYGGQSSYVELTLAVRIIAAGWIVSYWADMTCMYLHCVSGGRMAFMANAAGATVIVLAIIPAAAAFGLVGGCLVTLAANTLRLIVSQHLQRARRGAEAQRQELRSEGSPAHAPIGRQSAQP